MKLQHLTIIFVIIIVPISLVLSVYVNNHIKTIEYQNEYNTSLINATYDGVKAFQLNTANNMYSTISNSKIRDIEAAIEVFYTSLGVNFGSQGYTSEELKSFTPALLFTLYDGYYIYSNYYDTELATYKYGLKPFIYYSCRYVNGSNNDFVINYTLDNTITVIGEVKGQYVSRTGHLINDSYNFSEELLQEKLIILDSTDNTNVKTESYEYIVYNNQKIYKEKQENLSDADKSNPRRQYFYYSTSKQKDYINNTDIINDLNTNNLINGHLMSKSAKKYYEEAQEFTNWVNVNLRGITQDNAVDVDGNKISDFASNIEGDLFVVSNNNNPLQSYSNFNEHRMNVIRKSIQTNLITSINTFSNHTIIGYEFGMPILSEEEWYKIENNICMVTFLQGLSIGSKVYNNYCVVSNDSNNETVGNDSIYIIDSNGEYHKPGCRTLIQKLNNGDITIIGAYQSSEFRRKSVSLTGSDANAHSQLTGTDSDLNAYYYPQEYTGCYDCIITVSDAYSTDDIIKGEVIDNNGNSINIRNLRGQNLQEWYMRALTRSRYDLYLTNGYLGIN